MTLTALKERCPAAFAQGPAERVGPNYLFISTNEIVDRLYSRGFEATAAFNKRHDPTGAHMIRFRDHKAVALVGDVYPELVWSSAHDATRAARMNAGLFRLVCSNGATIDVAGLGCNFAKVHEGFSFEVEDEVNKIIGHFTVLANQVRSMKERELSPSESIRFAQRAWQIKCDSETLGSLRDPTPLLQRKRKEDEAKDLWTVYNVVQEYILRGGVARLRGIGEPRARYRVDTQLFKLAEEALTWN